MSCLSILVFLFQFCYCSDRLAGHHDFCLCMLIKATLTDQDYKLLTCFWALAAEEFIMSPQISSPSQLLYRESGVLHELVSASFYLHPGRQEPG